MDNGTDLAELTMEEVIKELLDKDENRKLKTEMDIWKVIEFCDIFDKEYIVVGKKIFLISRNERHLLDTNKVSDLLDARLKEFGVISPSESPQGEIGKKLRSAPKRKTYYWDWYLEMRKKYYTEVFKGIICSACPFANKDQVELMRTRMPCSVFPGIAHRLAKPYVCAMTDMYTWNEEILFQQIREKGGEDILQRFRQKIWTLKNRG